MHSQFFCNGLSYLQDITVLVIVFIGINSAYHQRVQENYAIMHYKKREGLLWKNN